MPIEDNRGPYFKGKWQKSIPYKDVSFAIDTTYDEPHHKRKKIILKKYPEITNLYGPCTKTKYIIFIVAILHFVGLYIAKKISSKLLFFIFSCVYGGTLTALGGILIHECTHDLVCKNKIFNVILGYISNIPIIIPIYTSFQKYHLDHHHYLGVSTKDPDLPLDAEIRFVQGNTIGKLIYITIYPVFYIGRALRIKKRILKEEIINILFHVVLIYIEYSYFGLKGIYFHIIASWFGYSLHPAAAHLIQEHFTFADGQETYSYYGWMNTIFLNIGYHNEHHDFCNVAWDKLPEIHRIANEYYICFMRHHSWLGVQYEFVTKKVYGPQSRLARENETHISGRKMPIEKND